ncbi:MAG: hypothetical protein GW762_04445, partial [Candidatus Pacebacteria bacterium]|nr:hypothetical protein [Candidatus Paceibacterota bacterium]
VYNVNDTDHDVSNRAAALAVSDDVNEKIATGIIYQDPNSVPFMSRDMVRKDAQTELINEVSHYDITQFTSRMR